MAGFVPDNPITQALLNPRSLSQKVTDGVSYVSKAMRLKILLDRNSRGFEKEEIRGPKGSYQYEDRVQRKFGASTKKNNNANPKAHRDEANLNRDSDMGLFETGYTHDDIDKDGKGHRVKTADDGNQFRDDNDSLIAITQKEGYTHETANTRVATKHVRDSISIIDIDYQPLIHDAIKFYKTLTLPFVPRDLNYNADSNFVGIATMGRNNPHYHFTGSEDTLTFTIDWFSDQLDRKDVIFNCRWLESLTKSSGYKERPHRVMLAWGKDNLMFQNEIWIVTAAPYILSDFVDSYRTPGDRNTIVSVGMLPQQAKQNITLKRVTKTNRHTIDIIGSVTPAS